jgi:hypothetical protein
MNGNGWIKFHRKALDNEVFRTDYTAWHVFEVLLLLADAKTGSWSGGTFQLSNLTGVKKPTLYKALIRLERRGMIARLVNSQYTVYNIGQWEQYQSDGKQRVNTKYTESNTLTRIENKELRNKNNHSEDYLNSFNEYRKMRKTINKPLTVRAEELS